MSELAAIEFTKPGQKFPTPSPGAGDRVFYESLYNEKKGESEMALRWCIEHGVLSAEQQTRVYPIYVKMVNKEKTKGSSAQH